MVLFKSALHIAWINLCRWKKDYRIWLVFLFSSMLIVNYLKPYILYCTSEGKRITPCMLPLLFVQSDISLGSPKVYWFLGCLLLLCDAPFLHETASYMILRGGRKGWYLGEVLYIFMTSFFYMTFLTIVSAAVSIPVIEWGNDWGSGIMDYVFGNESFLSEEIWAMFPRHIPAPELTIMYLYPIAVEIYTYLTGLGCMFLLGLMVYLFSLVTRKEGLPIALGGILVLIDPLLTFWAGIGRPWWQYFSPISWTSTDNLRILDMKHALSVEFVAAAELSLIALLLLLIAWKMRRMEVSG